nr:HAD family hydrolase [Jannaschia rubra]
MTPMKRCVIFDLDGTLCDTAGDLLAAANAAFAHLGHDIRLDPGAAEDRAVALRGGRAMLRLGFSRVGPVDDDEVDAGYAPLLDAYGRDIARHTVFYPGAVDAVQRLRDRGDAVGICTNKPEELAVRLMAELGATDLFDSLVGADTLAVRKPHPEHLVESIRRAGGDLSRSVMIGDTETDRETATAAKVPCVLVTFAPAGGSVADLRPDALLHDYAELEAALHVVGL